jgi:transcriptional regulator with XRE-family HTH domain
MTAFKEKFTKLWERRGLDQAEMAARLGYSAPTFNKRLNGKLKMKRSDILNALDVLSSTSPVSAEDANELLELAGYEGVEEVASVVRTSVERQSGFGFGAPDISERYSESRIDILKEILREIAEMNRRTEEIRRVVEELLKSEERVR